MSLFQEDQSISVRLDEGLKRKLLGNFQEARFNPVFLVLSLISENWNL